MKRKKEYYERTRYGWMLHSELVKMRRSMGQIRRWSQRRNLWKWLKECVQLRTHGNQVTRKNPVKKHV